MSDPLDLEIRQALHQANRIMIASHVRPDGDAVGSLLGLGLALIAAGKNVCMVLTDGVPQNFRHLKGSEWIVHHPDGEFDMAIVVDASEITRIGNGFSGRTIDLNIDHHITNTNFARINLVEPEAVATSSVLAEHLTAWDFPITHETADALLTGIIADSLGFRTSNMNPLVLRQAAELMEHGANISDLYVRALVNRSFEAARYWGSGLSHLQKINRLVWTHLTLEDREAVKYPGNDDADLVNILSTINDADVALIFIEQKGRRVKISWRAQNGVDVSQIAVKFGGGGHHAASGAEVTGDLELVETQVLQATIDMISGTIEAESLMSDNKYGRE